MKFKFFARMNGYDFLVLKTIVQKEESVSAKDLYDLVTKQLKKYFPENGEPHNISSFYRRTNFLRDHEMISKIGKPHIFTLNQKNRAKILKYLAACGDLIED